MSTVSTLPASGGRRGAEIMTAALRSEGVRVIFGHPGGAILPFYDALHDETGIRHILVRHEQSAAHAADGYARMSGAVGVCVATSGPGATNLVTGLATAYMDGVPVVAITGQVPRPVQGTDAFQETDVLGITLPITKHGFMVERVEDLDLTVREAFRIARRGRPGPVLIDVPKDVLLATTHLPGRDAADTPAGKEGRARRPRPQRIASWVDGGVLTTTGAAIAAAARLVRGAQRPVLLVGHGVVRGAVAEAVKELVDATGLPVVTTLLARDGFPPEHPLALGMAGMHGSVAANQALQRADMVVGLGARFDDRVTGDVARFAPSARIVHFDIDARILGRTVQPCVAVVGDLRETFPSFARALRGLRVAKWWTSPASGSPASGPTPGPAADSQWSGSAPLDGRTAARLLADAVRATEGVVVTDVGQHQMWLAQELLDVSPGSHLTSGGLGTMGYALPAAIGATVACPGRAVWVVAGDGGFQMSVQELATVADERLPLRIAVMNNGALGMVRQWQHRVYGGRYVASRLSGPDLLRLAEAYGIEGRVAHTTRDLQDALRAAHHAAGPMVLDIRIPVQDEVFPMLPPGAALHELIAAPPRTVAGTGD